MPASATKSLGLTDIYARPKVYISNMKTTKQIIYVNDQSVRFNDITSKDYKQWKIIISKKRWFEFIVTKFF